MAAPPNIHIRVARPSDVHAINLVKTGAVLDMIGPHSRIVRNSHRRNPKNSFGSPRYWRDAVVAVVDGRVVGVARTQDNKLSDLWVEGTYRSHGIGTILARAAETRIRNRGYRRAFLYTAIFNARGRVFYERNGWLLSCFLHHRVCHFRRCVYVKRL